MLYLYRKQSGLSWADLSGVWPQPYWRTSQDLWYMDIEGQVRPILEERARAKAKHNHRG